MPEAFFPLVARLTHIAGPSLYRSLYGLTSEPHLTVSSRTAWEALPLLTKQKLLDTPILERTFLERRQIDTFYASSGTTGAPLFGPRAHLQGPEYQREYHDFSRACLSSILLPHMTEQLFRDSGKRGSVVGLDPKNIRASVALARASGVDSVLAHSFLMPLVCERLAEAGISAQIRYVEIAGEPCSPTQLAYIRAQLPNAAIVPVYGAREVEGPIGIPCRPAGGEPVEVYHLNHDYYAEILDDADRPQTPRPGTEGTLVISAYAGEPFACPLLRYRTGDRIRVLEDVCARHDTWSFTVLGREADFIKIPGGVLRADVVEAALKQCGSATPDEFTLEYQEEQTAHGLAVRARIAATLPEGADPEVFIDRFSHYLRVGPTYTYADGVRDGVYLPLTWAPMSQHLTPAKRRRIIRITHEQ